MLVSILSALLWAVSHAWGTPRCLSGWCATGKCQLFPLSTTRKPSWCSRIHIACSLPQTNPSLSPTYCHNILSETKDSCCFHLYRISTDFFPILMLDYIFGKRRSNVHSHFVYPAVQTAFQITTTVFSSELIGCYTVLNSASQIFSLPVSEVVIRPQEVPIAVPARPIDSNQHHDPEEDQTERRAVFTCVCHLLWITLISPNFPSASQ